MYTNHSSPVKVSSRGSAGDPTSSSPKQGLNGIVKETAPMPTSPERRVFAHRTTSTLSHRHTDSTPSNSSDGVLSSPSRQSDRRPPLKAKRSSIGAVPVEAWSRAALPAPTSPTSRRRAASRKRLVVRAAGVAALLLLTAAILSRDRLWTSTSAPVPEVVPRRRVAPPPIPTRAGRNSSHTHLELANLQSTLAQPHSATVAALIVCNDATIVDLRPLLAGLERQTLPPSEAIVLCEVDVDSSLDSTPFPVSVVPSAIETDPARAILASAQTSNADFIFVLDADTPTLAPDHLDTLVHAAGTVEYSAALLTSRGLAYLPAEEPACHPELDGGEPRSSAIHLPSAPYLVQRTWLSPAPGFESGLRLDLPHGHALALALWLKAGITAFALPLAQPATAYCNQHAVDASLASSFLAERAVTEGEARSSEEYLDRIARGVVAVVVADGEELLALAPLACRVAAGATASIVVYLREGHIDDHLLPCWLDIRNGGVLDAAADDVVLYASDRSVSAPELRAVQAWTSSTKGRRAGAPGPTAILIPPELVGSLDWAATLDLEALRNWHRPHIDLAVITNNRPESLSRLLRSLITAEYYGDEVALAISLEQTADLATQRLIEDFHWPHGPLTVRHRIILGGLMPAITEAWYPASNDSYGVFLEDDVELSPLFYGWLKYSILKYRYSAGERSSRLFGVSLYQQKALELRPEGRRPFDAHVLFDDLDLDPSTPYLSQVPCSWGAVYFPEVWREFHLYLALRLSEMALGIADVVVPDARSNRWPRSWKKYFVELVYARGYLMLYPNYPAWRSFSTNHLEAGTHIRSAVLVDAKRKAQFEVPLAPRSVSLLEGLPHGRLPGWPSLPVLDLWGSVTSEDELVERGWSAMQALGTCPVQREPPLGTYDARELLCERPARLRGSL